MSRIGKLPVGLPGGVSAEIKGGVVRVKGPKGQLEQALVDHIEVSLEDGSLLVTRTGEHRQARSNHGLMRSLVANMVTGVSEGFKKELQVLGVGYRAEVKGKSLVMNLGYSHPIEYSVPEGVSIEVDKSNKISVLGSDKQQVGQVAAEIRAFRKPDSYKGKGVRYVDERVRIKTGKTA